MVYLPNEVLTQILGELKKKHMRLAPLACVNHPWQTVVENINFSDFNIGTWEINDFEWQRFFRPETSRRKMLRHVTITSGYYFDFEKLAKKMDSRASRENDADDEAIDSRLSAFKAEHVRFFQILRPV